jgi:hypothetical protein
LDARPSALNILFILRRALPYAVGCRPFRALVSAKGDFYKTNKAEKLITTVKKIGIKDDLK